MLKEKIFLFQVYNTDAFFIISIRMWLNVHTVHSLTEELQYSNHKVDVSNQCLIETI